MLSTRRILATVLAALVVLGTAGFVFQDDLTKQFFQPQEPPASTQDGNNATPDVTIVATDLDIPWEVRWLPDGDMLVTERPGTLLRIGEDDTRYEIDGVRHTGEGGLLGLALHPDFTENRQLYLYMTAETDDGLVNRVERYRLVNDTLTDRTTIIDDIPGASYHDGGRIAFGPDGLLYITTGDAGDSENAQDRDSLAGKILRLTPDGSIPDDNPFGTPVYSWGHRNPQGLTWDSEGRLWSTEHGRSGVRSGFDELNLIEKGKNYGWPEIQGQADRDGLEPPVLQSGPDYTWAPASAQYYNGSVFFGGLRGSALYEADTTATPPTLDIHLREKYGRIRAVTLGPDDNLYFTTSNTDGRGNPQTDDDRLLRVDPASLQ